MDIQPLIGLCPQLRRYALHLTRNRSDAEDLVQDAIEKAWKHRDKCDKDPLSWMRTIMRRVLWDQKCRYPKERVLLFSEMESIPEPCVSPSGDASYALDAVLAGLERMSPTLSGAFVLHRIGGLEYAEVAKRLGVPVGTVRSRISRAQEQLVG